jgi:hypothetical protein
MGALASKGWSTVELPPKLEPTATHAQLVRQSTPTKEVSAAPGALGVVTTLQLTPFHVRASVLCVEPPEAVHVPPTAVHDVALKQLTPSRKLPKAVGVLGVGGDCVHAEPFHTRITFA